MTHVLFTTSMESCLPFLDDDNDGAQQEDEHYQASGAHTEDQPHLLGVLRHLQSLAMIFTGRYTREDRRAALKRQNANIELKGIKGKKDSTEVGKLNFVILSHYLS